MASSAPTFTTLDELVVASDVVVVATVAGVEDGRTLTAPEDPEAGFRTRLVELDVTSALVGDVEPGDPLIVEEPAALLDGTPVVVDGLEPLAVGEQAVWFLVAGTSEDQPYLAVVNGQGRYRVVGDALDPPTTTDPLATEVAALGLDGLRAELGF